MGLALYNDEAFPPSEGYDQNDIGAYGGPLAALWPAYADAVPIVIVNGQPAAPYEVFSFNALTPPTITFSNGFSGGQYYYTLDGSNPSEYFNFTQIPLVLSNSAQIRVMSQSANQGTNLIAAPVTVIVAPGYNLTASSAGGGGVFPTGGFYLSNTVAVLTATNAPGWTFMGWSGDASGNSNPLSIPVTRTMNVQAVFGTPLGAITLSGKGIVQTNPALAYYPYGSTVQLMAIPTNNPATYFKNWNGAVVGNTYSPLDFVITNPSPAITAVFGGLPGGYYSLNLLVSGSGNVSPNPQASDYASGTSVAVTATPLAGYIFIGWSNGTVALGAANPLNVTMNSSMTVTAAFASTAPPPALPPVVALTNPVAATQFTLPANITLDAAASDPNSNGAISQVAFFAQGTNQLGVATNAPYSFVWTNPPAGTNNLTAVALNNFGLTATSAVISVTVVQPPPGQPVFTLSSSTYSVYENGGAETVTVQKSLNSSNGIVNYSTQDGSAVSMGSLVNYQSASGSLTFNAGDVSKTVSIPIVDNTIYEGDTSFVFSLSPSGDGSTVGSPGSATVTIIDVNPLAPGDSLLLQIFPQPAPTATGQLSVYLAPAQAGGQWRFPWDLAWRTNGQTVNNLPPDNYPLQFQA